MGKRGNKKAGKAKGGVGQSPDDILAELGGMFKQMPPNKRTELNGIVERLLKVTSSYIEDEPATPTKLFAEFQEIYDLVQKAHALETQFNMSRRLRGSRGLHMAAFLEWLDKFGADRDGVEAVDFGHHLGYGLKVTRDLKMGDKVMSIPRKCFMSAETAKDSTLGTLLEKDPMLKAMPNVALALHLLLEKNSPASFWEPYINVLPNQYNTVMYFNMEEFQELKGSASFEDALKQYKYVARQYAYFYRKFSSTMIKDYFTFDDYRWAVSTVMTRQNQIPCPGDNKKTTNTLVPFWDFANHESRIDSQVSTDFSVEDDSTVCMANRAFKAGEQFTMFYGVRNNGDCLVHNGFVSKEKNHQDSFVLRLGISKNDPLAATKFKVLDKLSIPCHGLCFPLNLKDKPFDNILLAFLRILCLKTGDEVEEWLPGESDKVRDLLNDETTPELDKKAFSYLETRCNLLLRSYPTDLEKDEQTLKDSANLSLNTVHILRLRIEEKKILLHTLEYCRKAA